MLVRKHPSMIQIGVFLDTPVSGKQKGGIESGGNSPSQLMKLALRRRYQEGVTSIDVSQLAQFASQACQFSQRLGLQALQCKGGTN